MKTASISISLASLILSGKALVGSEWSVTNVPSTGLKDITFPLTIVEADHISGYYFAQQYAFINSGIGYTGLQPRPDANGKPVLHGVFSSFIDGSTTTDKNCAPGADGGPGVSCSVEWNGVYGRRYDFEVKSNGSSVWTGTAIDTVTGARIHIGSYTVPASAGGHPEFSSRIR
ncbi:Beta-glucan synthesis-associated [Mycena sanguinolenta]|uniref:Beta-glucan synthesis-associated n=1 Tax=Mycena sanguinolenta TaxID=230812 RepID=A0A8H6ZJ20_9AGAR|nr:Beta-glucan synthesis-associated [Mycena sanguinolenta]